MWQSPELPGAMAVGPQEGAYAEVSYWNAWRICREQGALRSYGGPDQRPNILTVSLTGMIQAGTHVPVPT